MQDDELDAVIANVAREFSAGDGDADLAARVLSRLAADERRLGTVWMLAPGALIVAALGLAITTWHMVAASSSTHEAASPVWVDRQGREQPIPDVPGDYVAVQLSPDRRRMALIEAGAGTDRPVWLLNLAPHTSSRPSADGAAPVWALDGRGLFFVSGQRPNAMLWSLPEGDRGLWGTRFDGIPVGFAPDGRRLLFEREVPGRGTDLFLMDLEAHDRYPEPLVATNFSEKAGAISPDGKWLAYQSNSSGRWEIYVRPFGSADGTSSQVSTAGGVQPVWSDDGRELFFFDSVISGSAAMVSVAVSPAPEGNFGSPQLLFDAGPYLLEGDAGRTYDVASEGRWLVMLKIRK
jgi:serine/threonine-protein kinase